METDLSLQNKITGKELDAFPPGRRWGRCRSSTSTRDNLFISRSKLGIRLAVIALKNNNEVNDLIRRRQGKREREKRLSFNPLPL